MGRKKTGARKARPKKTARPRGASRASARATGPRRATTPARGGSAAGASSREIAALKARHEREKSALEKRLTDTVHEISRLRHNEARVAQLERQLKERDETIARLRAELAEARKRDFDVDDEGRQPSLALGSREHQDLDDYEDDLGTEDDDELI